jgi:site-specific recombinase XerD
MFPRSPHDTVGVAVTPYSGQDQAPLLPERSATARPESSHAANALVTFASNTVLHGETPVRLPAILPDAGEDAVTRVIEYFTARIRNPHTRRAYFRYAIDFLRWCEDHGLRDLRAIKPARVAAYIEQLQETYAKPSVKQPLAPIPMLFDWLVTGQVIDANPAHAVRGPKHIVSKGKTPVLTPEEPRILLDSIPINRASGKDHDGDDSWVPDVVGLRDRSIIAAMV